MRVYWNTILVSSHDVARLGNIKVMQRNDKTNFRSKLRLNASKIIFLPGTLEMLFKETSLDPNVAVSLEKQLFST